MNAACAVIAVFLAVFTGLHGVLFAGVLIERRRERRLSANVPAETLVSVIVPVRNEEALLPALLESLAAQTYPQIEFIFIDDCSTDASPRLLAEFQQNALFPVNIITMEESGNPPNTRHGRRVFVNRKQAALGHGIAAAHGGILLFTDADCVVNADWAAYMARCTMTDGVGVVLGPVYKIAAETERRRLLHAFQSFDQLVRGMYIAGAAGLGAAGGGFGNNIAVRAAALEEAGGYKKIPESVTEDAALISHIRRKTNYTVRAVYGAASHVYTRSEPAWKALINQTLRWHIGGLFSKDAVTSLSFGALALLFLLCTLCIPFSIFYPALLFVPLAVFLEVFLGNLPPKIWSGKSLPVNFPLFIFLSFFIEYFFTLLTLLSLFGKKPNWQR